MAFVKKRFKDEVKITFPVEFAQTLTIQADEHIKMEVWGDIISSAKANAATFEVVQFKRKRFSKKRSSHLPSLREFSLLNAQKSEMITVLKPLYLQAYSIPKGHIL